MPKRVGGATYLPAKQPRLGITNVTSRQIPDLIIYSWRKKTERPEHFMTNPLEGFNSENVDAKRHETSGKQLQDAAADKFLRDALDTPSPRKAEQSNSADQNEENNSTAETLETKLAAIKDAKPAAESLERSLERSIKRVEKELKESGFFDWITGTEANNRESIRETRASLEDLQRRKQLADEKVESSEKALKEIKQKEQGGRLNDADRQRLLEISKSLDGISYVDREFFQTLKGRAERDLEHIEKVRQTMKTAGVVANTVRDGCVAGTVILTTGGTGSILLGIAAGTANGLISNAGTESTEMVINNKPFEQAMNSFNTRAVADFKNASVTAVSMGVGTQVAKGALLSATRISQTGSEILSMSTSAASSGLTASGINMADEYRLAMDEFQRKHGSLEDVEKERKWQEFSRERQLQPDQLAVRLLTDTGASIAAGTIGLKAGYTKASAGAGPLTNLALNGLELAGNAGVAGGSEFIKAKYSGQEFNSQAFSEVFTSTLVGDTLGNSIAKSAPKEGISDNHELDSSMTTFSPNSDNSHQNSLGYRGVPPNHRVTTDKTVAVSDGSLRMIYMRDENNKGWRQTIWTKPDGTQIRLDLLRDRDNNSARLYTDGDTQLILKWHDGWCSPVQKWGPDNSSIKVQVRATTLGERRELQVALIKAMSKDAELQKQLSGWKTLGLEETLTGRHPNGSKGFEDDKMSLSGEAEKVFTIYLRDDNRLEDTVRKLDSIISREGVGAKTETGTTATSTRMGVSNRITVTRDVLERSPDSTKTDPLALVDAPLIQAIKNRYGVAQTQRLSDALLRKLENTSGLRGNTLGYDSHGNLVLKTQSDSDDNYHGGVYLNDTAKLSSSTFGDYTDRQAYYALARSFNLDPVNISPRRSVDADRQEKPATKQADTGKRVNISVLTDLTRGPEIRTFAPDNGLVKLYNAYSPSVARIWNQGRTPLSPTINSGSGFFITDSAGRPSRLLATAHHVVKEYPSSNLYIEVADMLNAPPYLDNQRVLKPGQHTARVIKSDPDLDLAILELDQNRAGIGYRAYPAISGHSVRAARLQEYIFPFGTIKNYNQVIAGVGQVNKVGQIGTLYSNAELPLNQLYASRQANVLAGESTILKGMSGGPTLSEDGALLGVNSISRPTQDPKVHESVFPTANQLFELLDSRQF